jgi:hypothetical protein
MILLNGCSFSDGCQLSDVKHAYPNLLRDMLDEEIIDLSEESKNNFYMAFELNAYILHKLHNNEELPRIIIWQHTDCFRSHIIDYQFSGTWKPNDLSSLLGRFSRILPNRKDGSPSHEYGFSNRFVKQTTFMGYQMLQRYQKESKDRNDPDADRAVREWGMGSKLQHRIPSKEGGSQVLNCRLGDSSFVMNHLQHAINVYNLQLLCNNLNIRLINYNYFSFGPEISQDPTVKQIDKSSYLLSDHLSNWGMYNHLLWKGFNQPDNYHFDEAAHLYQAEVLYDFIVNNKQLETEDINFLEFQNNKAPVFDYVNEIGDRTEKMQPAKMLLLKKAFGIK